MKIWLGSDDSHHIAVMAQIQAAKQTDDKRPAIPSLYSLNADVGVVTVAGSLVDGDAGYMQLYGMSGYHNISNALIEAVQDKKAKSIMLHIDSGGGDVSGLTEMVNFINKVKLVKPMSVFAKQAGSAAYWIASAGGHITLDMLGQAGSIGAVAVHTEYSKMYADIGITKTVIRSGEYKAKPNSVEPLDEKGRVQVQESVDYVNDMFEAGISAARNISRETLSSKVGSGRVFIGRNALNAGLVDTVGDLGQALAYSRGMVASFKSLEISKTK